MNESVKIAAGASEAGNAQWQSRKDAAFARAVGNLAPVFVESAKNAEMWDVEGRRYIDFAAGIAVCSTGHTNPKVTAINSALEVDLTGQVCAESLGSSQYSGVGGQVDFIRGAALSPGGKPIIALNSQTSHGASKIVTQLKPGAIVTTSRAHVHYVVTEFGVAYLYGKNLRQRASALIAVAHPDHREKLERDAFNSFHRH